MRLYTFVEQWLVINWPVHVGCLCGGWNTVVVDAETGEEWLVPGTHADDPAAHMEI